MQTENLSGGMTDCTGLRPLFCASANASPFFGWKRDKVTRRSDDIRFRVHLVILSSSPLASSYPPIGAARRVEARFLLEFQFLRDSRRSRMAHARSGLFS